MARTHARSRFAITSLVDKLRASGTAHPRADILEQFSPSTLTAALASGTVTRVGPGLYADSHSAATLQCKLSVAQQWLPPSAAVTGMAALWCLGWRPFEPDVVHAIAPVRVRQPAPAGLHMRRSDLEFEPVKLNDLTFTSPADSLILAWRYTNEKDRLGFALDAFRGGLVRPGDVSRRLSGHPRVPHRELLVDAIVAANNGVASALEYRAHSDVFVGTEWEQWVRQAEVVVAGRRFYLDFLHEESRVVVEFDGARFHSADAQRRRDIERDALLAGEGYVTVRLTWEDVWGRPEWCRQQVRKVVAQRMQRVGSGL